jgi:hypothetical protein
MEPPFTIDNHLVVVSSSHPVFGSGSRSAALSPGRSTPKSQMQLLASVVGARMTREYLLKCRL